MRDSGMFVLIIWRARVGLIGINNKSAPAATALV